MQYRGLFCVLVSLNQFLRTHSIGQITPVEQRWGLDSLPLQTRPSAGSSVSGSTQVLALEKKKFKN